MFARLFSTSLGVAVGLACLPMNAPAHAADEIEAKVQTCAACHGEAGIPTDPKTIPVIWGQQQSYLMKQLRNFRNGERESPIMTPLAKELSEQDLRKIAAYFAAKPWPATAKSAAAAAAPKGIAQCQACHQPTFQGGMPAPRLAGLSYDYLLHEMNEFAAEERTNNLDMPKLMQALSPAEREMMARYLSQL
jgi:cytochrome c553